MTRTEVIDLTTPIRDGGWHYDPPYFAPQIWSLESPSWVPGTLYSEAIKVPLQSGTYIESGAHCDPAVAKVWEYPLERTVLLPSVCIDASGPARGCVRSEVVEQGLDTLGVKETAGLGLLINTGWSAHWDRADFLTDCPYFDDDVADLVIEGGFSLIGSDTPRFEQPEAPSGHIRRMFEHDVLLLAPLTNMERVGRARGQLIAAPLAIEGVCATPTRAMWIPGD